MKALLIASALVACSSPATPTTTTTPTPTETTPTPTETTPTETKPPETTPTPTPTTGPGIGEKCGDNDACAAPATCAKYYGIAGARGPEFKTCEIKCSPKGDPCPAGRTCSTIADGPGSVCR